MEKKSEKDVKVETVGNDKDGKKEEVNVQGVDPPKAEAAGNEEYGKKEEGNAQGEDPSQGSDQNKIMVSEVLRGGPDRMAGCAWEQVEQPKRCMAIGANLH